MHDDDAAAEIADWVAFTSDAGDESGDTGETDVVVDVTDDSIAAVISRERRNYGHRNSRSPNPMDEDPEDAEDEPHEDTIEFFLDDRGGGCLRCTKRSDDCADVPEEPEDGLVDESRGPA